MSGTDLGKSLIVSYELSMTNMIGETERALEGSLFVDYSPWMQRAFMQLPLEMPDVAGVATLKLKLSDQAGHVLHRNFMHFEIVADHKLPGVEVLSVPASDFSRAEWSQKQWNVMDGKKVNGAGKGFFQYTIAIPDALRSKRFKEAWFLVEASAKELFVKDQQDYNSSQDFMKGSTVAPSANPNAYPMTDETLYPSEISVLIGGEEVYSTTLADDPADHRGVLSWHHQLKDKRLREAGSYGYLIKVPVKKSLLKAAMEDGALEVEIQTRGEGGLAIYGKEFGRYALDPSLVLK